ncbi:hypothetical protein DICVIV_11658 [Dictyocaulus viviparus]|uniref:Endoplasmic reticulum vesicle transporter C-terminal domain-containing protein n=1 Tax=Dictyocaulus viviparus TaxID=29172 RepID=A0A0D8XF26_DICVI|nr:hypothetical protein DICVIV_11658 [Dictyocaulus viviparus]
MFNNSNVVRHRRGGVRKIIEEFDVFEKVVDDVKEEKKSSSGLIALICFSIIFFLVVGEVIHYFSGAKEYSYRFDVDTALYEISMKFSFPNLDIDMVVATPCSSLTVLSTMDESGGIFAPSKQNINKDPTRFEFTDEEKMYWTVLRHAHSSINNGGIRGLEELQYIDSNVQDNLEKLANQKQNDEAAAINQQRENKEAKDFEQGQFILMVGNGMGMFQIVASSSHDEGTACRIHGRFPVRKGNEDKIIISLTASLEIEMLRDIARFAGKQQSGNISHRIEKFNFGPRVRGLVSPLAGAEQISQSGHDIYRYFIKVVPTKIYYGLFGRFTMAYQYSVTFLACDIGFHTKKKKANGQHNHGGIFFEYEFCANVIEIREATRSIVILFLRLSSVVGGVFATSRIINNITQIVLNLVTKGKASLPSVSSKHSGLQFWY